MTILEEYIIACTNLYGCVPKDKVIEIFNQQTELDVENLDTADIFVLEEYYIIDYDEYYVQEDLLQYEDVEAIIKMQSGKPHYVPTQEELLKYIDIDYFEVNEHYENLAYYLKEAYLLDDDDLEETMFEIIMEIKMCKSPEDVIKHYEVMNFEIPDEVVLNDLVALTFMLYNNTRRYENNGFTPSELSNLFNKED